MVGTLHRMAVWIIAGTAAVAVVCGVVFAVAVRTVYKADQVPVNLEEAPSTHHM